MDLAAISALAWYTSYTKEGYDAVPLLRAANDMAGKILRAFIPDILWQYHIAFKDVVRTIQGVRSIHTRNLLRNTNLRERLHGWFASRCKCARGINWILIFCMATLHNIGPHGGMNRMMPAAAAGIDMGGDVWFTLMCSTPVKDPIFFSGH